MMTNTMSKVVVSAYWFTGTSRGGLFRMFDN